MEIIGLFFVPALDCSRNSLYHKRKKKKRKKRIKRRRKGRKWRIRRIKDRRHK